MSIIKKYFTFLFFFILLNLHSRINAQYVAKNFEHIDPKNINTLSSTATILNFTLDWNFGQVFSKTIIDTNNFIITTGFLQAQNKDYIIMLPTAIASIYDSAYIGIKIFPNPVISKLFVYESVRAVKIVSIHLYNINGKLLNTIDNQFELNTSPYIVNFETIAPGYYIIAVTFDDIFHKRYVNKFKIIKL